jgi:hypothetical protein
MTTPAKAAKAAGLHSLHHMSQITGTSVTTLHNWFNSKPDFFEVLLLGAVLHYEVWHAVDTERTPTTITRDGYSLVVIPHNLEGAAL